MALSREELEAKLKTYVGVTTGPPQVAPDAGWDALTLLTKTCQKAGLPVDAWSAADTQVLAFGAQVFSEKTHPPPPKR